MPAQAGIGPSSALLEDALELFNFHVTSDRSLCIAWDADGLRSTVGATFRVCGTWFVSRLPIRQQRIRMQQM